MPETMSKQMLLEEAFQNIGGFVIIDKHNNIVYMNENYARSLDIDIKSSLGKKVTDIIKDSRLPIITETGKEEIASFFTLKSGQTIVVNRIPIKKNGKVIGAMGFTTFANIDEVDRLNKKISDLNKEAKYYKAELESLRSAKYSIDHIISGNPKMIELKELTKKIAQTKSTVLISGESGTGKELFAHAIHQLSPRSRFPFIRLNCAAIPENLLEAELFGYEEGAFTGAKKGGSIGKFELANGGSLLLDEINTIPLSLQAKLLRAIQEKEVQKIGSNSTVEIDVRLIFTTNQNLLNLVKERTFREDLYYRIDVVEINIPPLRERLGDIPRLISYLIPKLNRELGLNITGIDSEVLDILSKHNWPGNVRELEHCLERAFNNALTGDLRIGHFDFLNLKLNMNLIAGENNCLTLNAVREASEKKAIIQALLAAKRNKKIAAEILGIDRSILYDKIKKYSINI